MTPTTNVPPVPVQDPFRFGWREVKVTRNGRIEFDRLPLTLEDLLHPQHGDVMPQSTPHDRDIHYLKDVLARRIDSDPSAVVYHDVIIDWDDPELRHHSPDISVIFGVLHPEEGRNSFHVAEEGVRPTLLIEVVSPDYRKNDVVTKVDHYHRAQVPWYVIVDRETVDGPARLIGYRYRPDSYEELTLDEQGRLWLEPLGIWLGTTDNRVVCYDGETGRELGDYARVTQELEEALEQAAEAERQAAAAELRADKEKKRADKEKKRADKEAREKADAMKRVRELKEALQRLQADKDSTSPESEKKD